MHESLLAYRRKRFLWIAIALALVTIAAYALQRDAEPPNGGTWLGYSLGGIGAVLILWLTALGVRKRSYRSTLGTLQGWVSAHVYLGLALLIIVTLHTGFQFGWNVHTLAYLLMCLVVGSGGVGVVLYLRYPRELSANRASLTREQLSEQLAEVDARSLRVASRLPPEFQDLAQSVRDRTRLGDGVLALLGGADRSQVLIPNAAGGSASLVTNSDQRAVIGFLSDRLSRSTEGAQTQAVSELLSLATARRAVLEQLRRDAQLKAWLQIWLYVHVPATCGLLAALIAHVLSVFLYW
jgi:hypothetical protein